MAANSIMMLIGAAGGPAADRASCRFPFGIGGTPGSSFQSDLITRSSRQCCDIRRRPFGRDCDCEREVEDKGFNPTIERTWTSRHHVDVRSNLYPFVQLDDVRVVHAKTTMRDGAADRARSIGPVNPV